MRIRFYCTLALTSALITFVTLAKWMGPRPRLQAAPISSAPALSVRSQLPRASRPERTTQVTAPVPSGSAAVVGGIFHADRVVPYFQKGPAARARARLFLGDLPGAVTDLRAALAEPNVSQPARLQLVLAWVLMQQKHYAEALQLFLQARISYPVLDHVTTHFAARCAYLTHQSPLALTLAQAVGGPGPFTARAQLLAGDALRGLGRWKDAAQVYTAYLSRYSGTPGEAEALLRLAQVQWKARAASPERIARLLSKADALAPHKVWGQRARTLLAKVLQGIGDKRLRRGLSRPSCALLLTRSQALSQTRRLKEAAKDLARARRLGSCHWKPLCRAATALGRLQAQKKKYRKDALNTLRLALRSCGKTRLREHQAKVKYLAAKVNAALGRTNRALTLFRQVERDHAEHTYADDAGYRSALLLIKTGRAKQGLARLRKLSNRYPKGDMQFEALWRLAWDAYGKGQLKVALALLEQSTRIQRPPPRIEVLGRDGYWRARILDRLGRKQEAVQAYAAVVKRHPLTFYALLSLSTLKSAAPETAQALLQKTRATTAAQGWRFGPSPVYRKPGFARAVELARLGLGALAAGELHALGIRSPKRAPGEPSAGRPPKGAHTPPTQERKQRLWAAAVLYDRAGLQHKSHWMVRHALRGYAKRPPRGTNRARWDISFPRAYSSLVVPNAKLNGLPKALVWGLMREESAFNPRLVSHANAVGLMQLLRSTAVRFRGKNRPTISLETLKRPGLNVPIGTRYLGWLLRLYDGNLVPTVASYNAGETKIFEWIRNRGSQPVDHFVEEIPFRETRNYVKRVLGSAFAYNVLTGAADPVFDVPRIFPPKLVVKARHWQKTVTRWQRAKRKAAKRKRRHRARASSKAHRRPRRQPRHQPRRRNTAPR
ncbi:MAG: transglycosylase SLT domain-containing protein [bacterium]